jgi:hypothetical protein
VIVDEPLESVLVDVDMTGVAMTGLAGKLEDVTVIEETVGEPFGPMVVDSDIKEFADVERTELFPTVTGPTGPLLDGGSTVALVDVVEFKGIVELTGTELLAWLVALTLMTVTETPDTGAGSATHCWSCCVTAVPHVHWRTDGQLDCGPEISGVGP